MRLFQSFFHRNFEFLNIFKFANNYFRNKGFWKFNLKNLLAPLAHSHRASCFDISELRASRSVLRAS